jgi:hypothetical protein
MKFLIMQFSPISRHFISIWAKYSPQQSVLRHRLSVLYTLLCFVVGFEVLTAVVIKCSCCGKEGHVMPRKSN